MGYSSAPVPSLVVSRRPPIPPAFLAPTIAPVFLHPITDRMLSPDCIYPTIPPAPFAFALLTLALFVQFVASRVLPPFIYPTKPPIPIVPVAVIVPLFTHCVIIAFPSK